MRWPGVAWLPPALLGLGVLLTSGATVQRRMPLRAPLASAVPARLDGVAARDMVISPEERQVAGMSDYVYRIYPSATAGAAGMSVYVGYYPTQRQGKTIHSPKNCLPGAGWEALSSSYATLSTAAGPVRVSRSFIRNRTSSAVVLYWYQGRGRIEADEYRVKWNLLRDSALRGRSDEALVRIMVPVTGSPEDAYRRAASAAGELIPALARALPT